MPHLSRRLLLEGHRKKLLPGVWANASVVFLRNIGQKMCFYKLSHGAWAFVLATEKYSKKNINDKNWIEGFWGNLHENILESAGQPDGPPHSVWVRFHRFAHMWVQ